MKLLTLRLAALTGLVIMMLSAWAGYWETKDVGAGVIVMYEDPVIPGILHVSCFLASGFSRNGKAEARFEGVPIVRFDRAPYKFDLDLRPGSIIESIETTGHGKNKKPLAVIKVNEAFYNEPLHNIEFAAYAKDGGKQKKSGGDTPSLQFKYQYAPQPPTYSREQLEEFSQKALDEYRQEQDKLTDGEREKLMDKINELAAQIAELKAQKAAPMATCRRERRELTVTLKGRQQPVAGGYVLSRNGKWIANLTLDRVKNGKAVFTGDLPVGIKLDKTYEIVRLDPQPPNEPELDNEEAAK